MIWKQYDAPDLMEAEASIAKADYLATLASVGNYPYAHSDRQCVLIKSPAVGYGSKCEEGCKVPIEFPNEKCKEAVAKAQGNMAPSSQEAYDLIVMPPGVYLDNRVISADDTVIAVDRSMPDAYHDEEADDNMLVWHNFWLVAIKGTAKKATRQKKKTIKEEKAAQKAKRGNNP